MASATGGRAAGWLCGWGAWVWKKRSRAEDWLRRSARPIATLLVRVTAAGRESLGVRLQVVVLTPSRPLRALGLRACANGP